VLSGQEGDAYRVLLQYAWKGFWRRRTRSLLAVLGIALSISLLVAVITITQSVGQAVASALDAAGADMVIQKRVRACPFSVVKLPKDLAEIDESVVGKLREHPGVADASGVLELWAFHLEDKDGNVQDLGFPKPEATAPGSAQGADDMPSDSQGMPVIVGADGKPKSLAPTVVAGIDPSKKTIGPVRVADRQEDDEEEGCCAVTRGRYLVPNDDLHVMISEQYANAKGLDLGDKLPLGLSDEFEVVGLLDISGAARIAGAEAFVTLKAAQALFAGKPVAGTGSGSAKGHGDPVVDTIFVSLRHGRDSAAVAEYAKELVGPSVSITTEGNVDAGTAALASVTRNSLLAVSGLVLLFALLLLVRNALDNVAQRVDEVGLMKAIGWRNADVARLFVAEAAYAGVIGGLLGSALGSGAGWLYGQLANLQLPAALNYFPPCSATEAPLNLPLVTNPSVVIFALGLGLALAIGMVAGLAASARAARLDPVEALRRL